MIRLLKPDDLDQILTLNQQVFGEHENFFIRRWLSAVWLENGPPAAFFGIFEDGVLCAMAGAMENFACEHVVSFGWLGVAPHARGRKFGRQLTQARARWAIDTRHRNDSQRILELSCFQDLIPYHKKHGFKIIRHHRSDTSCIMQATAEDVLKILKEDEMIE